MWAIPNHPVKIEYHADRDPTLDVKDFQDRDLANLAGPASIPLDIESNAGDDWGYFRIGHPLVFDTVQHTPHARAQAQGCVKR